MKEKAAFCIKTLKVVTYLLSFKRQSKLSSVLCLSGGEFFTAVLCCCALYLGLNQSWLHPSVLATTEEWEYQGFLFTNLLPQQTSRVGVGRRLGRGIPWKADPNWPNSLFSFTFTHCTTHLFDSCDSDDKKKWKSTCNWTSRCINN